MRNVFRETVKNTKGPRCTYLAHLSFCNKMYVDCDETEYKRVWV